MPMGSKSKRYRCRRKKTSDLVVDISGTGFAGPEQHSTAIPALDPACDENKNQSLTGSLIGALMKPCCGIDTTTEITKVKKTKQNKVVTQSKQGSHMCLAMCITMLFITLYLISN